MPAGRWMKLAAGTGLSAARSSFSPELIATRPAMTVTNSSFECRCGGMTKPAGNFRRSTNGPSLPGLPSSGAACAPGGSDGGAAPHLTSSAEITVWCCACAAAQNTSRNENKIADFIVLSFRSVTGDDDLEVLARHDHRAVPGAVVPLDERQQVAGERRLGGRLQRAEGFQDRAVPGPEHFQPVRRRAVAE